MGEGIIKKVEEDNNRKDNYQLDTGGIGVWTTVYLAQNKIEAEKIKQLLDEEGLLVKLRSLGAHSVSTEYGCIEILVPKSEVKEAHEIIQSRLSFS